MEHKTKSTENTRAPVPSNRLASIMPAGKDGWELHSAAVERLHAGEDIIMLSQGDHDFDTPPQTVEACVTALRNGHHHYLQISGLPELREAMARVSTRCTGVPTGAAEVIATPGGQAALYSAVVGTIDPNGHAIVVAPYYATYPGTFRAAGANFSVVETRAADGFQPDVMAIAAAVRSNTRAILINTPNNPTGALYTRAILEGIAEVCLHHNLWLISDEVYWTLSGAVHVSPRALPGMAERTLVVNSMSKSHGMTGWRLGWLTGPSEFISLLDNLNLVTTYGLPDFSSRAATKALDNNYGVEEISARYAARRTVLVDAVLAMDNVSLRGSQGGMFVMIDISAVEPDDEKFAWTFLDRKKVSVMPGSSFGEAAAGHIRLALCQPENILREAADRLRRFIAAYPSM